MFNYLFLLVVFKINDLEWVDIGMVIDNSDLENFCYIIDFEVLESYVVDFKCKLFIVCNLMNFVGFVLM